MKYIIALIAVAMIILIAAFAPQLMQLAWGLLAVVLILFAVLVLIGVALLIWLLTRTLRG